MKTLFPYVALIALLTACSTGPEKQRVSFFPQSELPGLAAPIVLQPGETKVYLSDYFLNPEKVDSVHFPEGLSGTRTHDTLTLKGSPKYGWSSLSVFIRGDVASIPVKRSYKTSYTFRFEAEQEAYKTVCLSGSLNGWVPSKDSLTYTDGAWQKTFTLKPGRYEYRLFLDGKEQLDPSQSDSVSNGLGGHNSYFSLPFPPKAKQLSYVGHKENTLILTGDASPLVLLKNTLLQAEKITQKADSFFIPLPQTPQGDVVELRVYPQNENGSGPDLLIPVLNGLPVEDASLLPRTAKHAYRMYFLMVDRFANGDKTNDAPVNDPDIAPQANYLGGDLAGVIAQTNTGYFDSLGVNTVWLSPIGLNPQGAWGLWNKNGVKSKFSGYHGYWPAQSKKIDPRMGTDAQLDELITALHTDNNNILLDYVANHVHEEHPVIKQHLDWATELYLPDGTLNTEKWDEHRLTTWFDTFLPTIDLENKEAADAMSDSAVYWFERFAIDGFRHDATKHIPESFWRTLTHKLKERVSVPQNRSIYQIGETYGSTDLINSYISSGMLDAQFDFNLYDAAVNAFANPTEDFSNLKRVLTEGIDTYGSHHLMGNISGNQDRVRFISYADGSVDFSEDGKNAGWTRTISNQNGSLGYERLAMLHAFNYAVPGIPVIYYGDEIGLPGANDPDNRRMMEFAGLDSNAVWLKNQVKKLNALRANHMSLLYGQTEISQTENLILTRHYGNETTCIVFNASDSAQTLTINTPKGFEQALWKNSFNHKLELSLGTLQVTLPPRSFEYIIGTL